jgi:hypothetical protein
VEGSASHRELRKPRREPPKAFFKRIKPEQAAALIAGIEERAPRVFAPKW